MACKKNKMACGGKKSTGGKISVNKFACGGKKKSIKRK